MTVKERVMKALEVLVPIWEANTPPKTDQENDCVLKIAASTADGEKDSFFCMVRWCVVETKYYVEPINIQLDGQIQDEEIWFGPAAFLEVMVQMKQLGIHSTRRFFDEGNPPKDMTAQLPDCFSITLNDI
jgi:hypothetical protein